MRDKINGQVLVTGASGFIGERLVAKLNEEGIKAYCISREAKSSSSELVEWVKCDLADYEETRKVFEHVKPDYVFHLASYVTGSRDLKAVASTFKCNLASAVNLLILAQEHGCKKIILAGSLEDSLSGDKIIPQSPYAAAKFSAAAYANMFYHLYKTPVVIAKLFMVYGPGQKDMTKLIPFVIESLLKGNPPKMSSGKRLVDWIYVDDVVDGLLKIAATDGLEGETIDLGTGGFVSIRDLVQKLSDVMHNEKELLFGALPDRPMEKEIAANIANTKQKLGWEPKVSLEEGLKSTVEYYKSVLQSAPVK
ncbi:MAG TPA: NAD(P)-dependent oxidoreductase [Ignavibacteriales bacterium]|nr:NAD(P)-dependent oxidoreductase [Ignavibacteriales bacterium]